MKKLCSVLFVFCATVYGAEVRAPKKATLTKLEIYPGPSQAKKITVSTDSETVGADLTTGAVTYTGVVVMDNLKQEYKSLAHLQMEVIDKHCGGGTKFEKSKRSFQLGTSTTCKVDLPDGVPTEVGNIKATYVLEGATTPGTTTIGCSSVTLPASVCATTDGTYVYFQIPGSPSSTVKCSYNGSSFAQNPTFSVDTGRWSCSAWTKGNPSYKINVNVDGQDNMTDENTALANPC